MIVLGIEGTAHTVGAAILDKNRIYSSITSTFRPSEGGINPRDAADFHFNHIVDVINSSITKSGISAEKIDLVAFSRGPGLPPSLKITAAAARAMSLKLGVPIVGINHPLGHVEIGRRETGANDPVMLYVSGGNTQIIGHRNGYYRVFGETLDIGIGNMLDKLARYMGFPFPGGPAIEELSLKGKKLLSLPYSVMGMDTAFSGIYTAAINLLSSGESREDVAFSVQEHAFSMMVETIERALYTTGKKSILLAGGVARNRNLRDKIAIMAKDAGVPVYETPDEYCMDNGAMIGQAGLLTMEHCGPQEIRDTKIDQFYRIDQAPAPWVKEDESVYENRGAESSMSQGSFHSFSSVVKERNPKRYRHPELDFSIRKGRTRREATMLASLRKAGIPVPSLFRADDRSCIIEMEKVEGITMNLMGSDVEDSSAALGKILGKMHAANFCHGDLTLNNIMISKKGPVLIDPSMGVQMAGIQEMAYDLRLMMESIMANMEDGEKFLVSMLNLYREEFPKGKEVEELMNKIEGRRRYA